MTFDLHTHTTASDGSLAPAELLQLAQARGVTVLAITDHDTLAGYFTAQRWLAANAAASNALTLIAGVEISTQWGSQGIHVLGLNVDPLNAQLAELLTTQQQLRADRAGRIMRKLEKLDMPGVAQHVSEQVDPATQIGRPHIAASLVALGFVDSTEKAFKKYLGNGKPADVSIDWATLEEVIAAINTAGGAAVIAHPAKYKMTASKQRALLKDFVRLGGRGIEVISGAQMPETTKTLARLAQKFELLVSCGSDFHNPDSRWQPLGDLPAIPESCNAVWQDWTVTR